MVEVQVVWLAGGNNLTERKENKKLLKSLHSGIIVLVYFLVFMTTWLELGPQFAFLGGMGGGVSLALVFIIVYFLGL